MQTHHNLQTPYFPHLPIPLLLSPISSSHDLLLRCFYSDSAFDSCYDLGSGIGVSRLLDTFPIGDALCSFLTVVLPRPIELQHDHSSFDDLARAAASPYLRFQVSEERVENATGAKEDNWINIVQFEVPEFGQLVEGACKLEKLREEILSKVSECDGNLEMLHLTASDPHVHEVHRSVYSVEDVPPSSSMDVKINISEEIEFVLRKKQLSDRVFPRLELEESIIGTLSRIFMEDNLLLLLADMEAHVRTRKYDNKVSCQELFCSMDIELISDQVSSKLFLEPNVAHPDFYFETGHEDIGETSRTEEEPWSHSGIIFPDSDDLVELVPFEECQMLGPDYNEISNVFTTRISNVPDKYDISSLKGLEFKNFDELIVFHEISMVDRNFKSFRLPILPDDEKLHSLYASISMILEGLKQLPMSASDEIYLDWDLLGKDQGNCDIHATFQIMFSDIGILVLDYEIKSTIGMRLVLDFILSDHILNEITEEKKMNMLSGGNTALIKPLTDISSAEILDGDQRAERGEKRSGVDCTKASLRGEHVPQFSELEFFLNPTKAITGMRSDVEPQKVNTESVIPASTCQNREIPSLSTGVHKSKWDIKLHVVYLPANMLTLIQNFEKIYIAVTEDLHLKSRQCPFPPEVDMLSLPEEKLVEYMKILCKDITFSRHMSAITSAFCALLAIKLMTCCLCAYGIHSLYIFFDEVLQKLECLRSRLGLLMPYIEEAYMLANKEITKLHPMLDLIQEILKRSTSQRSKILIVADKQLWWPLKNLLVSMNVSVSDITLPMHGSLLDASEIHLAPQINRSSVQSDCLLATHEHISAAILLKQFDIILEFGGLQSSSKVSSIFPKSAYSLNLHFLKVELDGAAKSLCTGVDVPLNLMKLEDLLNFVPTVENCKSMCMDTRSEKMDCCMPLPVDCMPIESESNSADLSSCLHSTIIVNAQNFDTEMIISRRSTYQRILSMERGGVHILERDFCLPVDVIISARTCLAWYDCKNIGKKATAPNEAASSVALCVDNIAANVLTTLSFTFESCIMVFEGGSSFIGTLTESSDELYAAAASLGIELQIFCSHSPQLTEEIVLNCIRYALKSGKSELPKLPESETIAESFLVKFPSINPFSALAILSTGAMLLELFGWSEDCRIRAVHKYHVPNEAIILLSVLSRYGKREECVSGMTDCSSSVCSALNSETSDLKFSFEKRKRECYESSFDAAHDFKIHYPSSANLDSLYKSTTPRLVKTCGKHKSAEQPLNVEAFYEELGSHDAEKISPIMVSEPQICWRSRDLNLMDDIAGDTSPSNSRLLGDKRKSAMTSSVKLSGHYPDVFKGLPDDLTGEVVDINDEPFLGGSSSSVKIAANFYLPELETDEAPSRIKSSRAVKRLSFEHATHPDSVVWSWQENDKRGRRDRENNDPDIFGLDEQPNPSSAGKAEKAATYYQKLLNKEKAPEGTSLRKAINSEVLQGASPWTKEFLKQVREKMRLHKQYDSRETSVSCGNTTTKATKRKSPSVFELLKYQGGRTPSKLARRGGRQKQCTKPAINENDSSMLPHPWTPADKRATQTLCFASSGDGGQTKLVWSDKSRQSLSKRFRGAG